MRNVLIIAVVGIGVIIFLRMRNERRELKEREKDAQENTKD